MHRTSVLGGYLLSYLFIFSTSVDAAKYLKTDGSWVDPIRSVHGDVHPYSGTNLRPSVHLRGAHLYDADLNEADLDHAWLSHAILTNADLSDADLSGAHLFANMIGANLTGSDLSDAIIFANLNDATLTSADLTGADMEHTNLTDANLTDANLTNANLNKVAIYGAQLRGANLSGSFLTNTTGWNSQKTTWTGSFYYTDNEPIWDSGMTQTWRDSAGILALDPPQVPEPAALLLALLGLAMLPRRRRR